LKAQFLDGHMMHHPSHYPSSGKSWIEWREVEPFAAVLTFSCFSSPRMSRFAIWCSRVGVTYPMFFQDMEEVLRSVPLSHGHTTLELWKVVKVGQYYGIALAGEAGDREPRVPVSAGPVFRQ